MKMKIAVAVVGLVVLGTGWAAAAEGTGYSFEVTTPDLKVANEKIDEIHLRYAAIRGGLGIRF